MIPRIPRKVITLTATIVRDRSGRGRPDVIMTIITVVAAAVLRGATRSRLEA